MTLLRVRFYHAVIGKDAAQYSINSRHILNPERPVFSFQEYLVGCWFFEHADPGNPSGTSLVCSRLQPFGVGGGSFAFIQRVYVSP